MEERTRRLDALLSQCDPFSTGGTVTSAAPSDSNAHANLNAVNTAATGSTDNTKAAAQFEIEADYTDRDGNVHTEIIQLNIINKAETQLDDIKVETTADATRAVETLDKALEEVSTAQAKLGAIQNRLTHNIDNLSKGSMLNEQSVLALLQ